jgi:hypothetical protein
MKRQNRGSIWLPFRDVQDVRELVRVVEVEEIVEEEISPLDVFCA